MHRKEPIKKVMTANPVSLQLGEPLSKARQLFSETKFHHLPIINGKTLVGILSSNDLVKLTLEAYGTDPRLSDHLLDKQFRLSDVMQKHITFLTQDETVRDASRFLSTGNFHSLPVVDNEKDRNLVGIITSTDLIKFLSIVLSN